MLSASPTVVHDDEGRLIVTACSTLLPARPYCLLDLTACSSLLPARAYCLLDLTARSTFNTTGLPHVIQLRDSAHAIQGPGFGADKPKGQVGSTNGGEPL